MGSLRKTLNIILFTSLLPCSAWARWGSLLSGFYWVDNFAPTSTQTSQSRYNYSFEVHWNSEKWKWLAIGGGLLGVGESYFKGSETRNYSSQDYGLIVTAFLDRRQTTSLSLAYNPVASGTFEETGAAGKLWSGTSMLLRGNYEFELNRRFHFGVHLNYYSASYTTEQQGSVVRSISSQRSGVSPSGSLIYWFQ